MSIVGNCLNSNGRIVNSTIYWNLFAVERMVKISYLGDSTPEYLCCGEIWHGVLIVCIKAWKSETNVIIKIAD